MRLQSFWLIVITAFLLVSAISPSNCLGQELGFLEDFVLAEDRGKTLENLVPGTQEYYYYYALHYQNTERLGKVDDLLEPWVKRHGESGLFQQIRNRQQLLKYNDDPQTTLKYLTEQLDLNFDHEREIPSAQRKLPTKLPADTLTFERLLPKVENQHATTESFTLKGLRKLDPQKLTKVRRRDLLTRLRHPDFPNLVKLVAADLREKDSKPFSNIPIHGMLTRKQLDELANIIPSLKSESPFVTTYLRKLAPSSDENISKDKVAKREYLNRLWGFTKPLNPVFNSIKAAVLFRILELDRDQGKFDRDKFFTYLRLPKNGSHINPVLLKDVKRSCIVDLNTNFQGHIQFPPIGNDEFLIREYLQHFFVEENNYDGYKPLLKSEFLKREFANAKILNGLGDSEKWASLLSPEEYQQLIERIDVDFDNSNLDYFKLADEVELTLNLKNANNLLVKVFRLNTRNYYRKYKKEVNTDINLDGLVPNFEETHEFADAPAIRKTRKFKFPQINKRGVYVVDFISGGKSSRALIRVGNLQITDEVTGAGQLFTILDQDGSVVADADLWISGARYNANGDGKILVPFSNSPGRVNAIVSQGDFSCLQSFSHLAESYKLNAGIVVDRESLIKNNESQVVIRPSLTLSDGTMVPVSLLENIKLDIDSLNLDGIKSSKSIDKLELKPDEETICGFTVPARLKRITFKLSCDIKNLAQNKTQRLTSEQSYSVNEIEETEYIQDAHLVPASEGHFIELLGKTGEVRPDQAVRVMIKTGDFKHMFAYNMRTDKSGLIDLGDLGNATTVTVVPAGGNKKTWNVHDQNQTYAQSLHVKAGDSLQVSAPAEIVEADRKHISLIEVRNGTPVADFFDRVEVNLGLITISGLDAGDYKLRLTYKHQLGSRVFRDINIRVTAGEIAGNLISGENRLLETNRTKPLHFTSISADDDKLLLKLHNADDFTRVHAIATRYQPAFEAFRQFANVHDRAPWTQTPKDWKSLYMEGRMIGDEYDYILRRKQLKKYPGNMLERPSVLLNPWAIQATDNRSQGLQEGQDFSEGERSGETRKAGGANKAGGKGSNVDFANLDFLGDDEVLITNLKPNKDGEIEIERSKLGNRQHVRFFAVNSNQTIQRNFDLPLMKLAARDSRLAKSLDPEKNFTLSKLTKVLAKGELLSIADATSARFQYYDDLSDVYKLYRALKPGTHLDKFEFVLSWNKTAAKEKERLYSKFACHELNYFIAQKDAKFFQRVVRPHLQNKRDKTFLDLYLLKEDLSQFTSPWNYARLNSVERILLGKRIEDRTDDIVRNVNEAYLMNPIKRAVIDGLYDASIRGLDLDFKSVTFGVPSEDGLPELAAATEAFGDIKADLKRVRPGSSINDPSNLSRLAGQNGDGEAQAGEKNPARAADLFGRSVGGVTVEESSTPMFARDKANLKLSINGGYNQDKGVERGGGMEIEGKSRFLSGGEIREGEPSAEWISRAKMRSESRTRMVPVTRQRTELRTRKLPDGSMETYQVLVPFTEMVTQNYTVQVPQTENVPRSAEYYKYAEQLGTTRKTIRALYRRIAATQEWVENNYYQLPLDQQNSDLVSVNRFWRDFANHSNGPFLSENFAEAHGNFSEMMFSISVLDLPFKGPEAEQEYVENSLQFTAGGPTIALHQQVREAIMDRNNTTVLVSENFFQVNDRYRFEDEVRYDKFISDGFLAHTLYGGQVVATNPTSTPRSIEILFQIPQGAVACKGTQETRTVQIELGAFSTTNFEYQFYFPTAGDFTHFPSHVSSDEKILAVADGNAFPVKDEPAKVDENAWAFVSQNGTDDQVINFINERNVLRLDLDQIAFRMKDKAFFGRAIESLRNRYVFSSTLWSYAIKHNDVDAIREFMTHDNSVTTNCGRSFDSEILTVDPIQRNWYQHKEYWPLINARAHQVGQRRRILNPSLYRQYLDLLDVLANRSSLTDDDHLVLTYYMLLQDRIESALEHFEKVSPDNIAAKLQYDYCDAYLDIYREQPEAASNKAQKWKDYPVDHWRKRFENILAQAEEIRGGSSKVVDDSNDAQQQTKLADTSESFELELVSNKAILRFQNLSQVDVNYYEMDIELLFSRSPFAMNDLDGFSMIEPNLTQNVKLAEDTKSLEFSLPVEMKNKNVLVEVVAGDQTKSQPNFANSLDIQMQENFGQLKVTNSETNEAISKAYVKVYGQTAGGQIRFHKDGYTDLRGRFDYVTQSNRPHDDLVRFSILILSDENGAVMKQAAPPKE